MPYVLFAATSLIWGMSFLLMRWAAALFNAPAVGAGRMLGGTLTLFAVWWALRLAPGGGRPWSLRRRDLPALGVVALVGTALPWILQPHLIGTFQESGLFGMMVSLVPLLTAVVSVPMLKTRPTAKQAVGVALGLAMLAVLFGDAVDARGVPVWAMALGVAVPLAYAVSNTWIKRRFSAADPLLLSAAAMGMGLLVTLPAARLRPDLVLPDAALTLKAVAALTFLGVVGGGLAMWMFFKMIQLRGPLFASMVTYVVPGIAVLLGWLLEGERVTSPQLLALAGILLSVGLVQWPATRQTHPDAEAPVDAQ